MIVNGKIVRNRMTTFKIGELSGVTRPAQTPALALAIKNATENTMDPLKLAEAEIVTLKATVAKLLRESSMSDAQRTHYLKLGAPEQTAFLEKSFALRDAELAEILKADGVVYTTTDGIEIRKSAGPIAKAMAEQLDILRKTNADQAVLISNQGFAKQAAELLGNLPKTDEVKIALVAAIHKGITDPKILAEALELLKAANADFEKDEGELGTRDGGTDEVGKAGDPYEALVTKKMAELKTTDRYVAIKALEGSPELAKVYAEVASSKPVNN